MDDIRQTLKENVKLYRKRLGLTQQKLAEACGVSTPYIGEIEIGRRYVSMQMLEKLCLALRVEPWKLFIPSQARDDLVDILLGSELRESMHLALDTALESIKR